MNKRKRFASTLLIISLTLMALAVPARASSTEPDKNEKLTRRVKAAVVRLGSGPDARVKVKLKDGTMLEGYVDDAEDDHFVVVDERTNVPTTIPYPQVKQVKGNNLSEGVRIAIGVAVIITIGLIIISRT